MRKEKGALDGDYEAQGVQLGAADRDFKGAEVFVGGLPRSVTESTMREIFSPYGEIVESRIMRNQSGDSRGFGFVRFAEKESAYIAQKKNNGIELQGKRICVALSLNQDSLFFGNLCKEWSAEEFENLVHKAFKDVISVDLPMASGLDSSTSKRRVNRGFAFAAACAHRIGSKTDFLLGGVLRPSIDWAEKESILDPDEMAKVKTAFVGNLPANVDEEYLKKLFEPLGEVERVAISRKGNFPVGFVHFANRAELDRAIKEMDGKMVRGPDRGPAFKIQVSVARPAVEKERKRLREEVQTKPASLSRDRPGYSYGSHTHDSLDCNIKAPRLSDTVPDVMDPYEAAVITLPSAVKERLLRVLRLGIGTRYDIDICSINSLKELPESAAVAVLNQFLLSGADKRDKGEYFASLIAKHQIEKFGLARSAPQLVRGNYLPRDPEVHNKRVPLQAEAVDYPASRYSRYSSSDHYPSSSSRFDDPMVSRSSTSTGRYVEPRSSIGRYAEPRSSIGRYPEPRSIQEPRSSIGRYPEPRLIQDPRLMQEPRSSIGRYPEQRLIQEPRSSIGRYPEQRLIQEPRSSIGRYPEPRSNIGRSAEAASLSGERRSSSSAGYRVNIVSDLHPRSSAEHPTERPQIRFDPFTGEPYKFDPFTGEPIRPESNPRRSESLY